MAQEVQELLRSAEKTPTDVYDDARDASVAVAKQIAQLIREKAAREETCVLGLATGSTPIGVYAELVRMHREEGLSFANVVTFNLDEYFPMAPNELQSYVRFMREHLFDHVDIPDDQVNIPDGTIPLERVPDYCRRYEERIGEAGGIDLQLLGIGRTGHIGFNEPGSGRDSRTRLITLDWVTRKDAASDFFGEDNVPRRAITMGVATIMDARRVVLIAFGEHKSPTIARAVEGEVTDKVAASFLQQHPNARIVLDRAAAGNLTRFKSPWVLAPIEWDRATVKKALIWLSQRVGKPILKLTDVDYNANGLQDLLAERGGAYAINVGVFRELQRTITGWPGGKPEAAKQPGDISRPADRVFPKRAMIFSPHPDDDVISMGGTLIRLVDQGHEVHVAYQTSGNIAVSDADAIRFADFAAEFNHEFGIDDERTRDLEEHVESYLKKKGPGEIDSQRIQRIKGLIRRGEARAAGRYCGIPTENLHFLDMPFYETGRVVKESLGEADVQLIVDLLRRIEPHQVYAAGDLTDPHGTHRTCLAAILAAVGRIKDDPWFDDCEVWLYRGAWQEWEPHEIEMAVPFSPDELMRKRTAIFKHESQKDKALFPGSDPREFWQRAEDRNHATAELYDKLGLAEYEAIEGFVRWSSIKSGKVDTDVDFDAELETDPAGQAD